MPHHVLPALHYPFCLTSPRLRTSLHLQAHRQLRAEGHQRGADGVLAAGLAEFAREVTKQAEEGSE